MRKTKNIIKQTKTIAKIVIIKTIITKPLTKNIQTHKFIISNLNPSTKIITFIHIQSNLAHDTKKQLTFYSIKNSFINI
jgi:hypothetical protein